MIDPTTRPDFQRLSPEQQEKVIEVLAAFEQARDMIATKFEQLSKDLQAFADILEIDRHRYEKEVAELERLARL